MRYKIGGTLTVDAPSYIERQADTVFYNALEQGEFCYVLNSRQMGKSSLMVRTMHRLKQQGFICATIDMTNIGSENITPSQWYKGVVADLLSSFKLRGKINLTTWWEERAEISLLQRLSQFIADVLLVEFPHQRLYIFIDEIDSVLSLNFPIDDFFALIRYCYNQRAINSEYERISFAIFGVATPSDLIQDKNRTPFNIGKAIELDGFQLHEVQPLAQGLNFRNSDGNKFLQEILAWTGGQPFLTQKLCHLVANFADEIIDTGLIDTFNIETSVVKQIVSENIIANWESHDEPEHFKTICTRILNNEQMAGRMLGIYQQILASQKIVNDNSPEKIELLLSGLVVKKQGQLQVKNQIYQIVFNQEWVARQLEILRPYAQNLKAWVISKQQDNSRLLRGMALKEALAWSELQMLSDIDYRFLTASQELEKQEIEKSLTAEKLELEKAQFTLAAAKEANRILAASRKSAKNSTQLRLGKNRIISFAVGVTCFILLLRFAGLLQGMEWDMLDRYFQLRPQAGIDPHIVVIAIDEPDLQQMGQYPIPDTILVQALNNLKSYQPTVIGLDLFRDLPVEPGHQELVKFLQETPNLIGIDKVVGAKVAPPKVLEQLGRVGFVDQVLDSDGKIRRALLTVRNKQGKLRESLGLRLALDYLKTIGITPHSHRRNKQHTQIGKSVLVAFKGFDGGYVRADGGGYQILLNYHGTEEKFQTFSIRDLLHNRIPKAKVQNRIVLIGTTAESINDFFQTPYTNRLFGSPKQMPGVFLHANIISQILNAAISGKGILRTWSETLQSLWILLWSIVGIVLSWRIKSSLNLAMIIILNILALIGFSYLAFLYNWWIPYFAPSLGLIIAAITLPIFNNRELEKIQLRHTVKRLAATAKNNPAAAQIAIEYLKQAEAKENQDLIDKIFRDGQ